MSKLIDGLLDLEKRWPGLFTFLRMAHGHNGDMTFEGFSALNEKIICDEEGLKEFTLLMTQIWSGRVSAEEEDWLKENGLVDPKAIEMKEAILRIGEKLGWDPEDLTEDERQKLKKEYMELKAQVEHMERTSRVRTAQALEGMKILS